MVLNAQQIGSDEVHGSSEEASKESRGRIEVEVVHANASAKAMFFNKNTTEFSFDLISISFRITSRRNFSGTV
jgi:hypothetical protein